MAGLEDLGEVISTDVLVVGGGIGGLGTLRGQLARGDV
jgi:glycerol-3-phosphate dehydrogenase